MDGRETESRVSLAAVAVLVVVLAVLATLQYRWIAQLSEAEAERLATRRDRAATEVCADFDDQLLTIFLAFQVDRVPPDQPLGETLNGLLGAWRGSQATPDPVRDLFVIGRVEGRVPELERLDENTGKLGPCAWEPALLDIRRRLNDEPPLSILDGDLPGMVIAIHEPVGGGRAPDQRIAPRKLLVVQLDLEALTEELQQLLDDHLGARREIEYSVTVAPVGRPNDVLFQSGPLSRPRSADAVSTERLFGLRLDPGGTTRDGASDLRPRPRSGVRAPIAGGPRRGPAPRIRPEPGRWLLELRDAPGSLEDVVTAFRHRNLAISLAILVLLGAAGGFLVVSSRRAERLARQQMDFVASVSHELRTPLTAIRSAGQNLADGIVDEPDRVRSYGLLIEDEGRRLTEMISRVLTFAGIHSGHQSFRMEPVSIVEIVETVLRDTRWILGERGITVEAAYADDLPMIRGDAAALRQVVSNLVDNAVKYGAAARWLGIRVDVATPDSGPEILITVSDRGPGVPKKEAARVFEPFHRGAAAASSNIPGSGLGLAVVKGIVEAHGGRIEIASPAGGGTAVMVTLPTIQPVNDHRDSA